MNNEENNNEENNKILPVEQSKGSAQSNENYPPETSNPDAKVDDQIEHEGDEHEVINIKINL